MRQFLSYMGALLILLGMVSCEEEYLPIPPEAIDDIVVEGYIEAGEDARPVFVFLTRALPFFSELDINGFGDLYVKGAMVSVTDDNSNEVFLTEICWSDLSDELKAIIAQQIGLPAGVVPFDLCAYVDLNGEVDAREGGTYTLNIDVDGNSLSAITTVPEHVPLDSLWFEPPRGEPNDSMAELWCKIIDPAGVSNYYRYLTATDGGPLIAGFATVTDDAFFDGKSFDFPLTKSEDPQEDIEPANFGLFKRGTSARIKWCNIDEQHFYFWNTLETSRSRQGPFSSYVRIASNIEGGLGIWGGYSVSYYDLVVPPK